jgi:DNA-binding NarL/FixJ family response regulator
MATMTSAQTVVAEDDAGFRTLITELLRADGHDVVEATCGRAALSAAQRARPRLAVLDVNLPQLSGYELCHALRERYGPSLPILVLSGERTESFDRVAGLLLGADDYMTKPVAPDEFLARVRALVRRGNAAPAQAQARTELTDREFEVLGLLAEGLKQREIADRLVISPKTVGTHIERILSKLRVSSRAEAVAVAYRDGLVSSPA